MQRIGGFGRVRVSADGRGVVSQAGVGLLREMTEKTGLVQAVSGALIDTYRGVPLHEPGKVFADLAVAIADGADAVSGIAVLKDRQELFGSVASMPTTWRVLDRLDAGHLPAVRQARAKAREVAWAAGAGPDLSKELRLDFDATITIAHSDKEDATPTWKHTYGYHPLLCFLDRPEVAGGEALAGLLRPGNAGNNTAADHIAVLDMALAQLPVQARPRPESPDAPRLLARSDSAGATHAFAAACRERGVGFSLGFGVDHRIKKIVDLIPESCWAPAINTDDDLRDGAWVAEVTSLVELSSWPAGSPLILRKERPHPGAQLTFTDVDGMADHRVPHRHRSRLGPGAARRAGAAAPAARPRRGPDPASQGHRVTQLALPRPGRERCLARGDPDRDRPGLLEQADLLRRPCQPRQVRDRRVSLPSPARRRAARPQRPSAPPADRPTLALGHRHRHRLHTATDRVRLTQTKPAPRPGPRNHVHRHDSRTLPMPATTGEAVTRRSDPASRFNQLSVKQAG